MESQRIVSPPMNTHLPSRIVSTRLPLAACLLMATAVCSAIDLPTQFPINMGFKSLYGSRDGSIAGNEAFDTLGNATVTQYPVHHVYKSDMLDIKGAYSTSLNILANANDGVYTSSTDSKTGTYMFPGFFLYYVGTNSTAGFTKTATTISVGNASVFINNDTLPNGQPDMDHVIIYSRNANGTPNWTTFEYADLTAYDVVNNTISMTRGVTGSTAKDFPSGAYIAPHVSAWEVNDNTNKSNFRLNYSMHAPVAPQGFSCNATQYGKRANQWAAEKNGANLAASVADGVEQDEAFNSFLFQSRAIDADNDGAADWGYFDGVNSFGLGMQKYSEYLRNSLNTLAPGKTFYIQYDSDGPRTGYRGWKFVNGCQMETFMDGIDKTTHLDKNGPRFSEAYEHISHWLQKVTALNQQKPFSYGYCRMATDKYPCGNRPNDKAHNNAFRRHFAVGLMVGMPHPYGSADDMGLFQWDEQNGGTLGDYKWLGTPSAAAVREQATGTTIIATSASWKILIEPGYTAKLNGAVTFNGTTYVADGNSVIEVAGVPSNVNAPNEAGVRVAPVTRPTLTIGTDYTLTFEAKASTSYTINGETFTEVPREIKIYGFGGYVAYVLADSEWRPYTLSFTSGNTPGNVQLGFSETIGQVWIRNIKLQQGNANRISREFANGKAFLNMTKDPWTVTLPTGNNYYYLKGDTSSTTGNPMNTGNAVGTSLTVPAYDAAFLHKGAVPAATPAP